MNAETSRALTGSVLCQCLCEVRESGQRVLPKEIAAVLGISEAVADAAMGELERRGLVIGENLGRLSFYRMPDDRDGHRVRVHTGPGKKARPIRGTVPVRTSAIVTPKDRAKANISEFLRLLSTPSSPPSPDRKA